MTPPHAGLGPRLFVTYARHAKDEVFPLIGDATSAAVKYRDASINSHMKSMKVVEDKVTKIALGQRILRDLSQSKRSRSQVKLKALLQKQLGNFNSLLKEFKSRDCLHNLQDAQAATSLTLLEVGKAAQSLSLGKEFKEFSELLGQIPNAEFAPLYFQQLMNLREMCRPSQ
jgi:hypothetical protein